MDIKVIDPYTPLKGQKEYDNDTNMCTVVTLHVVTGNPYEACKKYMAKFGRKPRRGMTRNIWTEAVESMRTFNSELLDYDQRNRITINQFIKKHPKGTYYCANNGHAFAIKDGVLYDHSSKFRRQITRAIRVEKKQD